MVGMVLGWRELVLWRGKRRMVGSLFQREGAALRKDLSENFSRDVSLDEPNRDSLKSVWDEWVED